MKKAYSLSLILALILFSCDKSKDFYKELGKGSYLTLVEATNLNLDANDVTSVVSEKVSSYGDPVASVNLFVSATPSLDKADWKLIKNVPFSGETVIGATHQEIATALGLTAGALEPGSVFYMYNEVVTSDGRKFSMINTSSLDLEGQPAFNVAMQWKATVVCPYETTPFDNQVYVIEEDGWADYAAGTELTVKLGPGENEITVEGYPGTSVNHGDLVIKVDPVTGAATVTRYNYGGYDAGATYTAATTGSSNFVFACTETVDVLLNHMSAGGTNYGNYRLLLKKK
ncbi:MAG: hypothetical protein QM791_21465 [Ferruginibacter sp.]